MFIPGLNAQCCFHSSSEVISDVKEFVKRLVDPNVSLGARDFYVPMLFFDILCFLTIAFGVSSFGVSLLLDKVLNELGGRGDSREGGWGLEGKRWERLNGF